MENSWVNTTIGDVAQTNQFNYSKNDNWKFLNYLDTGSINENNISDVQYLEVGKDKIPSRAKRKVVAGDIIYSTVRPDQRHYGIIKNPPENLLVSTGFATISCNIELVDSNFIYWYLTQETITNQLHRIGEQSASTYPSIKPSDIEALEINLPPLPEQKAIAHILGTLDNKIELNRQMNETLEAMAQALFKSWFVDFDPVIDNALLAGKAIPEPLTERAEIRQAQLDSGKTKTNSEINELFPSEFEFTEELGWIPKGWLSSKIANEFETLGGGTPSTKNPDFWENGNIHWTTPKDLSGKQSNVLLDTDRKITELGLGKISSGLLPVDTVLMSSRAPVGYLALAKIPVAINQGYIAFKCNKTLTSEYAIQWAESEMDQIKQRAGGTTFAEISKRNFRDIDILVPSMEVVLRYSDVVKSFYDKITANEKQFRTLTNLRDTLLPKLMSGELRIPDAEKLVQEAL